MGKFLTPMVLGIFTLIVVESIGKCSSDELVGGLLSEKPINEEVQNMVATLNSEIAESIKSQKGGRKFRGDLVPVSYKTQLVNGINYFIKVRARVGRRNKYYHVRVYKSFSGSTKFAGLKGPMRTDDTIGYF